MKKLFFMVCCAALLMTGCKDGKNAPGLASVQQTDSLNDVIAQKDSEINEMMGTLNDIEEGFRLINEAENRVALLKNGEGTSKKQNLKENIQFIAERMKQNRELIAKLQKQLESSTLKGGQLKKTIENLTAQLEEKDKQLLALREELDKKDIHISELDETIGNLNTNVSNLSSDNQQKAETINAQDKQLNTAWYVFGTKKELKGQHILEGGKVMNGNFNKNYFTKVDIRNTTEIKLYSKSAKLLTAHPASSYSLTHDASKQYVLRITNPQIFWSTSKYLVVLVK
jgi:putative lipoprotein